jgi:hypothetical protein
MWVLFNLQKASAALGGGHQKVGEDCPGLDAVKELQELWEEEVMTAAACVTFVRFSLEKTIPSELNLMTNAAAKRNVKPHTSRKTTQRMVNHDVPAAAQ